jgi:hypothetical protein
MAPVAHLVSYWLLLVPIRFYCLLLAPEGSSCSCCLLLAPIASPWLLLVPFGSYCLLLSPITSLPLPVSSISSCWLPLLLLSPIGRYWLLLASFGWVCGWVGWVAWVGWVGWVGWVAVLLGSYCAFDLSCRGAPQRGPAYKSQFGYYRRCWSQPPQSRSYSVSWLYTFALALYGSLFDMNTDLSINSSTLSQHVLR